ncbi:integrating conjugative element protein, partial [Escherichia coli]|nr:integrating conjugative element protein [Escherichia coli]
MAAMPRRRTVMPLLPCGVPTVAAKSGARNFWAVRIFRGKQIMKHKPQLINVVALAVMLTCSTMAGAAENERSTFGLSLPQVNDSAIGYGKSIDGAISDKLFY